MDNPFTKANQAQSLVERLHLELGMKVIDVGCGPGRVTIPTAQKVGPQGIVTAMDIQARMLERVQKKAATAQLHNLSNSFKRGIGEKKLEHNYYDRALLVTVLGEIPNQHAAFKEIFNALKPGGLLLVSEVIFDPHFQRMETVQSLANTIGFEQKETIGNRFAYTMQLKNHLYNQKTIRICYMTLITNPSLLESCPQILNKKNSKQSGTFFAAINQWIIIIKNQIPPRDREHIEHFLSFISA